ATGKPLGELRLEGELVLRPDRTAAAKLTPDKLLQCWDLRSGQLVGAWKLDQHEGRVLDSAFSEDLSVLATVEPSGKIHLWNTKTGRLEKTLTGGHDDVAQVAVAPDGSRVLSFERHLEDPARRRIRLWQTKGEAEPRLLEGTVLPVARTAFSRDGRLVATAS